MEFTRRNFLRGTALPELAKFLVQAQDREIVKVGIVPYFVKGGERHYLIASPKPSRDKGAFLPFTLARGTRKGWLEQDGNRFYDDLDPEKWSTGIGDPKRPFDIKELEPLTEAALREGREELAVHYPVAEKGKKVFVPDEEVTAHYALKSLIDCGTIGYKDYPIQFFVGELQQEPPASYSTVASAEVRLVNMKEAARMAKDGEIKQDYFERLQAIDGFLEEKSKGRRR